MTDMTVQLAAWGAAFISYLSKEDSWAEGNGKRNSLPGPQLRGLPYLRKIRESSVMENDQYQDPPCRPPEFREPQKQYTC